MSVARGKPPRLEFDLIEESLAEEIVRAYGVGPLLGAAPLVMEGGRVMLLSERSTTSRKIVLLTEFGKVFLKQVPWYCDEPSRIRFVHDLMTHLSDSGLSVPRLLRTPFGESWVEMRGERYTLSEYLPGPPYSGIPWQDRASAETLACLHAATLDYVPGPLPHRENLETIVRSHALLALQGPKLDRIASKGIEWVAEQSFRLFGSLSSMPLSPVHGDFIPWNLAFNSGRIVAIYDFDNSCLDSRLHDLGEAIIAFFALDYVGRSSQLSKRGWTQPEAHRVRSFLETYEAMLPLRTEEKELLALYVLGSWWECLLLAYIRNERPQERIEDVKYLPSCVRELWHQLGLRCPLPGRF